MTTTETISPFLRPSEAAALLRCSRQSIYRLVARGEVPSVRLSPTGPLLIPKDELRRRLNEGRN
jgi:excisionase family DNA binding protein